MPFTLQYVTFFYKNLKDLEESTFETENTSNKEEDF